MSRRISRILQLYYKLAGSIRYLLIISLFTTFWLWQQVANPTVMKSRSNFLFFFSSKQSFVWVIFWFFLVEVLVLLILIARFEPFLQFNIKKINSALAILGTKIKNAASIYEIADLTKRFVKEDLQLRDCIFQNIYGKKGIEVLVENNRPFFLSSIDLQYINQRDIYVVEHDNKIVIPVRGKTYPKSIFIITLQTFGRRQRRIVSDICTILSFLLNNLEDSTISVSPTNPQKIVPSNHPEQAETVKKWVHRMQQLLGEKRFGEEKNKYVFQDPILTLNTFADALNKAYPNDRLKPYQLSKFLNETYGRSFNNFVNYFRVKLSKTLLLKFKQQSTLQIGMSVGFNSLAVYNAAFRKETGLTPGEFRQLCLTIPLYGIDPLDDTYFLLMYIL